MKHKRFEENILVDEAYTNYGRADKNEDRKKSQGIAKNFAESLEYDEKKKWYHQLPPEPPAETPALTDTQIEEIRKEANSALHGDTLAYETKTNRSGSSDHQWAKTLLNKGAIGDRVAAATILIQDNPVHNLTALRNMINQVKPAKKKDGIVIIDALSELLVSELLIPGVKLRAFAAHPLARLDELSSGNRQARRGLLKLWCFEDQLKELYGTYVEALNKFAHDSVLANKEKAVSAMSYLLMHHPEREKMLLTNIINKLGDPSQAVASKVVYHLCQLLFNHPNMKRVVLADIEKMLFRNNISPRAQYYGVCFLNQFYLGKDDANIAEDLIRIYFSFFKASIKKGDIESRLMSAILTGVKRAYPFADPERLTAAATHVDAIFKLAQLARMNVAVSALALLQKICTADNNTEDRYYLALYRKLTHPEMFSTTHSALLFSLIYKSLKGDNNIPRVIAFTKRLLQLCCYMSPAQACGLLFLISQVFRQGGKAHAVKLVWTKREDVKVEEPKQEDPEPTSEAADTGEKETETPELAETEREEAKPETKKVDLLKGDKKDLMLDDEEESYVDLKLDEHGNAVPKRPSVARSSSVAQSNAGWHHASSALKGEAEDREKKILMKRTMNMDKTPLVYNAYARNPSFAGAECAAYVELAPLAAHAHPTVRLFAERLASDQLIQYTGDPLKDFSCIRFLDRFVFKNPKLRPESDRPADGVRRVRGSHPKFAVRKNYAAKGIRSIPVTSSTYLNEDATKIPVDERFLYDFLQKRRSPKDEEDSDSDNDSVTSADFEQYLDTVTGARAHDASDEELDFLSEMEAAKKEKKKKKKNEKGGEASDDDQLGSGDDDADDLGDFADEDDGSDGELDISADEHEPVLSGDEDELMLENSDGEEGIDLPDKRSKKDKMKLSLKGKDDLGSLFASAEEFSTLLEETATSKKQGSSQAMSNTDNSSHKQMAWEEKRDRWIKGYNHKILGNKRSFKNKKFNKKENGGFVKMADGKKEKKGGKRPGGGLGGAGGKRKRK